MNTHSNMEIEVKVRIAGGLAKIRTRLREQGFSVSKRRVFEQNIMFDTLDASLSGSGKALRIRRAGREFTLTYKGPPETGARHKSREEIETKAGDFESLVAIVTRLGYFPKFRYEKYRTEYQKGKTRGVVTLDETPVGVFLEIEGAPHWIDRIAGKLGFSPSEYITRSYADLYRQYCEEKGLTKGDMVFQSAVR